jgi:hypothetical protein
MLLGLEDVEQVAASVPLLQGRIAPDRRGQERAAGHGAGAVPGARYPAAQICLPIVRTLYMFSYFRHEPNQSSFVAQPVTRNVYCAEQELFSQAATLLRFAKQTGDPPRQGCRAAWTSVRKRPTWSGKRDLRRLLRG